jgi:methylglutaconyl-CoA hydratase
VRVIVLAHEGPVFCAGADLRSARQIDPDAFIELLRLLRSSPKPVVAEVRGAVRGGGMGLVGAADLVVASKEATFGCPEVRIGAAPAMVSAVVLDRLRRGDALALFLLAEPVDARRAYELGLVTEIAPDASDVVRRLLLGGPGALALAKRLVNERPGPDDLDRLAGVAEEMFAGDEAQEGIAAFREKRPPRWAPS